MKIKSKKQLTNKTSQKNPKDLMNIHSLPFLNLKMQIIMTNHQIRALWRKWLFAVSVINPLFLPPKHSVDIASAKSVSLNIFWFLGIALLVRLPFEIRNTMQTKRLTISLKAMLIVWERVRLRNIREGNKKQKITKHKKRKISLIQLINN